ncbi:MAG TPA: septation protein SepH [Mycobacteriales bacterium]|jgi:hypothetical protein|nr:septation protein SepH [Mycobacteriales bacterium]
MREAKFIGMSADGESLVVELDGEHILVAADDDLRKALAGDGQMSMPLEARLTPREVQHRIRCGQTAAEIAAATGVAIELIARFEGPVLDERRHHAEQARRAQVDGQTLADRAEEMAGGEVPWDSWLGEDDRWRVRARLGEHRSATWAWDPRTRRLRALDDVARTIQTGGAAADVLDAVLRPVATTPRVVSQPEPTPEPEPVIDLRPDEKAADADADVALDAVEPELEPESAQAPEVAVAPTTDRPKRRASVPSWDDIVSGTTSRRTAPPPPDSETGDGRD